MIRTLFKNHCPSPHCLPLSRSPHPHMSTYRRPYGRMIRNTHLRGLPPKRRRFWRPSARLPPPHPRVSKISSCNVTFFLESSNSSSVVSQNLLMQFFSLVSSGTGRWFCSFSTTRKPFVLQAFSAFTPPPTYRESHTSPRHWIGQASSEKGRGGGGGCFMPNYGACHFFVIPPFLISSSIFFSQQVY